MRGSSWARWRSRTSTRSTGCRPAISIDQKGASRNPRSHRRHGHRDLRPPAAAVRAHRPSRTARTATRSSARRVQQIVDQVLAMPEGTRLLVLGPAHQGPQDRGRPGLRGGPASRASCASGSTASSTTSTERRRSTSTSATRSRSSSTGSSSAAPRRPSGRRTPRTADRPGDEAAHRRPGSRRASPIRSRPRCGWARASWSSRRRRARASRRSSRSSVLSERYTLPVRRHDHRRARAAQLLVQLAPRRLPGVHRPRHAPGVRPRAGDPGPGQERRRTARVVAVGADAHRRAAGG